MKIDFSPFEQGKTLIVGDLMLDRYWIGPTSRISPEAPVPVVNVKDNDERAGGAGNVALNIACLGGKVSLIGLVGDDENGQILEQKLIGAGVECHFEKQHQVPTITKLRILSRHQQLLRLDFEQPFAKEAQALFESQFEQALQDCSVVVLSDYAKGTLSNPQKLIQMAKAANKVVVVDPKGHDFEKYRGADLLTPNFGEFEAIVGTCDTEQDIVQKGAALIDDVGLGALLVTRGEKGMTLLRQGQSELHLPAKAREVYDVTGAGDTVIGTLAAALAAGSSVENAMVQANLAAAIVVGQVGTAPISATKLRRSVQQETHSGRGVMTQEQMKYAIEDAKSHGERVVMTNGCFDILHAGHVAYLEQAKALGDRLIVAVNSDESVKGLKGDGRPVNPLERRMSVLAGLASVDWVVPFSDETPQSLIADLLPDILVKGGDYRVEDIAGASEVMDNGGDVQILNFVDGVSTTAIINKINQKDSR
jgi:D-beta-D-heptose 7-phosphate kinase / D-beta-D-heptose 1-phosphate adenosyltransferase